MKEILKNYENFRTSILMNFAAYLMQKSRGHLPLIFWYLDQYGEYYWLSCDPWKGKIGHIYTLRTARKHSSLYWGRRMLYSQLFLWRHVPWSHFDNGSGTRTSSVYPRVHHGNYTGFLSLDLHCPKSNSRHLLFLSMLHQPFPPSSHLSFAYLTKFKGCHRLICGNRCSCSSLLLCSFSTKKWLNFFLQIFIPCTIIHDSSVFTIRKNVYALPRSVCLRETFKPVVFVRLFSVAMIFIMIIIYFSSYATTLATTTTSVLMQHFIEIKQLLLLLLCLVSGQMSDLKLNLSAYRVPDCDARRPTFASWSWK